MFGSGNNPVVDIGISMTLQDRFTSPAANMLSSWRSMLSNMSTFSTIAQQAFTNSINRNLTYLKGAVGAFEHYAEVQKNAFLTNTVLNEEIDRQNDLMRQAKDLNLQNPLNLMDITSGQKFMAMAGMSYKQIQGAIKPAADMAALFNMELGGKGGTADLMTNVMATFKVSADQASNIGNILAVGTTSANMSLSDLAQSIKYVGANAKMAGMDVKDITAAIGVLGNYGIQGSMAGTNLGQALTSMNKAITGASDKGLNALKSLGISPEELKTAEGNLIPVHDILIKLSNAMAGMGSVEKQGILFNLFGQRGIRAMLPLLEDITSGTNNFEKILGKLNNSANFLSNSMDAYMKSPQGRIDQLKASWDNFKVSAGAALSSIFVPMLKILTPIVTWVSQASDGWGKWVIRGMALVAAFKVMRGVVGLISFSMKAITSNMFSSTTKSQQLAGGLGKSNIQAAQLEAHLRNITILLAQTSLRAGQTVQLWGGSVSMTKKGPRFLKNTSLGQGAGMWGPIIMGGPGAIGGSSAAAAARVGGSFGTPLYRTLHAGLGNRTAALGMARVGAGIAGGFGRLFGILMGPWGMALSIGAMCIPSILDWLFSKGDDKQNQQDIAAKKSAENADLIKAIREGNTSRISIDINGNAVGTFRDGDRASIDLGGDYVDYSLGDY